MTAILLLYRANWGQSVPLNETSHAANALLIRIHGWAPAGFLPSGWILAPTLPLLSQIHANYANFWQRQSPTLAKVCIRMLLNRYKPILNSFATAVKHIQIEFLLLVEKTSVLTNSLRYDFYANASRISVVNFSEFECYRAPLLFDFKDTGRETELTWSLTQMSLD